MFFKVPSKPMFSVDVYGNVCWTSTGTVLSSRLDKDGYPVHSYRAAGKTYHISKHRAVAEVFVENPRIGDFNIVNHKDSDKLNCSPENLEWTNHKGNRAHCQFNGNHNVVGDDHSQCKIGSAVARQVCEMLELGLRRKEIAETLGIPAHQVSNIKSGKSWRSISKNYKLDIPRKETISKSTLLWLREQVELGNDLEDILNATNKYSSSQKERIKKLVCCKV